MVDPARGEEGGGRREGKARATLREGRGSPVTLGEKEGKGRKERKEERRGGWGRPTTHALLIGIFFFFVISRCG